MGRARRGRREAELGEENVTGLCESGEHERLEERCDELAEQARSHRFAAMVLEKQRDAYRDEVNALRMAIELVAAGIESKGPGHGLSADGLREIARSIPGTEAS